MADSGFRLVVLQGPDRGRDLSIQSGGTGDGSRRRTDITIGRQSDRKLRFGDDYVSRRHAHIVPSSRGLQLIDDDSLNGTSHNGTKLTPGVPVSLRDGDELSFGPYTVVEFRSLDGEAPRRRSTTSSRNKARVPKAAAPPRERFGPYAVYHGLDRGIHDRVDVATRPPDSTPVVLKRFNRNLSRPARRRIRERIEAARHWKHANIAAIRTCGELDGTLHVVRRYVDGIAVDRLHRTRPTTIDAALAAYLIEQAAVALAYAHEHDAQFVQPYLSHRNLILARTGEVVLINFGMPLTSQMVADMDDLPPLEARFVAPECSGSNGSPLDSRAEVFALGLMLFELLAGGPVDLAEVAVLKSIDGVRPDVPRALADVTMKALKLHAVHRYDSPAEMGAALRATLRTIAPGYGAAMAARAVRDKLRPPPVTG